MIEAIVFDLDGLLFDSERIVQRSWENTGDKLGYPNLGSHIYNTLGKNIVARREYFCETFGEDFPFDDFAVMTRARFYEIVEEEGLPTKPGVIELLKYGKEHGYKMAVATSSRRPYAENNLKNAEIYDYFDGMVCGDMVTHSKPDPEVYLKACAQIGADPQNSIALEDAPNGIRAAHAAGMYPVMIPDLVQPTEEIKTLLYRKYDTLHEVITLLEETKGD